jgi:phage virion morphogenesis protein
MTLRESINRKIRNLKDAKTKIPVLVSNNSKNFFLQSFRNQGFTDNSLEKWQKRDNRSRRNSGRAILVDTGALRRSIKVSQSSFNKIVITSNLPYASVHNYGLKAGRGRGFKMPKRKFMGNSKKLNQQNIDIIKSELTKIFKA